MYPPTLEEMLDFYINEYIKRHGSDKFEKEIKRLYYYRPQAMLGILVSDYANYIEIN